MVLWSSGPLVLWSLGPLVFGCGSWKATNTARSWQEAACGAFEKDNIGNFRTATKTVNDSILTLWKARKLQIPMSAVLEKLRMFAEQRMLQMS